MGCSISCAVVFRMCVLCLGHMAGAGMFTEILLSFQAQQRCNLFLCLVWGEKKRFRHMEEKN